MAFTVSFRSRFDSEIPMPTGLYARPLSYAKSIRGGCLMADIEVSGDVLLLWSMLQRIAQRVVIFNGDMQPVWWGYVEDVLINRGTLKDGLSLKHMYNRVRIHHSYEAMGETQEGVTTWAQNAASVTKFGFVKELQETIEDAGPAAAVSKRDTVLARHGAPVAISEEGSSGQPVAIVHCKGDVYSLGWKYYDQPAGRVAHDEGDSADQPLGLALQSAAIGFNRQGRIYDMAGRLNNFPTNVRIIIAGSQSNNGVRTVRSVDSRPFRSYTSTDIAFDAADDIFDHGSDPGLGFIEVDDFIKASGALSANNLEYKQVKTAANAGHLEVRPQNLTPSGSPPYPVTTIIRGNYIETEENGAQEFPSDTRNVSIAAIGVEVAQTFRLPQGSPAWTLNQIELRVKKVGNPIDMLQVDMCAHGGTAPGAVLATATVAPSAMGKNYSAQLWQYNNTMLLQPDVTYWLRSRRTGAPDVANYYVLEVDEGVGYADGGMVLFTGSNWVGRSPNASLLFRILGAWETSRQMQELVVRAGQYVTSVDLRATSGVLSNQYRDGSEYAYDELLDLLDMGTASGDALIAEVTAEHILRLSLAVQVQETDAHVQTADGRYLDPRGRPLPEGVLPVGKWLARPDIPAATAANFRMSPRLVEEAAYDCRQNKISRVRFVGEPDVLDLLAK